MVNPTLKQEIIQIVTTVVFLSSFSHILKSKNNELGD